MKDAYQEDDLVMEDDQGSDAKHQQVGSAPVTGVGYSAAKTQRQQQQQGEKLLVGSAPAASTGVVDVGGGGAMGFGARFSGQGDHRRQQQQQQQGVKDDLLGKLGTLFRQ
jgi:hypothetical protein